MRFLRPERRVVAAPRRGGAHAAFLPPQVQRGAPPWWRLLRATDLLGSTRTGGASAWSCGREQRPCNCRERRWECRPGPGRAANATGWVQRAAHLG